MNGRLTEEMGQQISKVLLARQVWGRQVWDLGAGDLHLAQDLLALGATGVVAVDRHEPPRQIPGVTHIRSHFKDVEVPPSGISVAFVSWAVNWPTDLLRIIDAAEVVIYLGSNVDGSACGFKELFLNLAQREVLAHVPDRKNTLLIYGSSPRTSPLTGEEIAALESSQDDEPMTFEEAQERANGR